jgi:hypothetical protein
VKIACACPHKERSVIFMKVYLSQENVDKLEHNKGSLSTNGNSSFPTWKSMSKTVL